MKFLIILILLSSCSQLPVGKVCTKLEHQKGSMQTSFTATKKGLQPTFTSTSGRAKYDCEGVIYWVNE